jgi:hypothetical protein
MAVPWGSSTFNFPYKVSSSAGQVQKRDFFFSTLKTIGIDGSFANKVGVLASQFKTGEILLWEAHGHLALMYDETSRQPIWNSPAFQITNPVPMNENGHGVIIPNPTQPESLSNSLLALSYALT